MHGKTILYFIIGILSSDILKGQCEDFIIESLPYTHSYYTTGKVMIGHLILGPMVMMLLISLYSPLLEQFMLIHATLIRILILF